MGSRIGQERGGVPDRTGREGVLDRRGRRQGVLDMTGRRQGVLDMAGRGQGVLDRTGKIDISVAVRCQLYKCGFRKYDCFKGNVCVFLKVIWNKE